MDQSPPAVDALIVASMRSWVADDFEPACRDAGIPLVRSHGLDVPDLSAFDFPAWWTPTEHAARLLANDVPFSMTAPGPRWMRDFSAAHPHWTQRYVWAGRVHELGSAPPRGWCKPAEFKHPRLPAQWWDDTDPFTDACTEAGIPDDSWVQVATERLRLGWEHRFFVAHGKIVGGSPYLSPDGDTWHEDLTAPGGAYETAREFAARVVSYQDGPPGYVLDVGNTPTGPVVIEVNPAFSSAIYGTDPGAALATIAASTVDYATHWIWTPDPYLVAWAARRRPLPRR